MGENAPPSLLGHKPNGLALVIGPWNLPGEGHGCASLRCRPDARIILEKPLELHRLLSLGRTEGFNVLFHVAVLLFFHREN
jgi:hypothetical protein